MVLRALIVVCFVLGGALGYFWIANGRLQEVNAAQVEQIGSLERSVASLTQAVAQSRAAAAVAQAAAARERAVALKYEALRDNFRNGGDDAALPCWFTDRVRELLGRVPEAGCVD